MLAEVHRSGLVKVIFLAVFLCACGGEDGNDSDTCIGAPCYDATDELGPVVDVIAEVDLPLTADVVAGEVLDEEDIPAIDEVVPEVIENLEPDDVKRIKGKVVDENGAPIPSLFVQPCTYTADVELCHKATTDENGDWTVNFTPAKKGLIGIHVRFVTNEYTPTACYWDMEDLNFVENEILFTEPFIIFDQGESYADIDFGIAEPTVVEGSGVKFTVEAAEWFPGIFEPVSICIERFPLAEYVPCFLDEGDLPDAVYSMTPDWLSFSTPGGIEATFENTEELAPGAQVNFFVLGTLDTQIIPLEGETIHLHTGDWHNLGTGTVSEDGSVITTDPGSGLPGIGWVGYKAL
jgi:hypothetical protein